MPTLKASFLNTFSAAVLEAAGAPRDSAELVGTSLVDANLCGHDSHGIVRLSSYVGLVRAGKIVADARPLLEQHHGAAARVDGCWGWGQPAARLACDTSADSARRLGIGVTSIGRCNHIGRLGEYVERLANEGLLGLALCNAGPIVAPYGGRRRRLGTNPLAFAAPRGDGIPPLVVDFATAGIAHGKLLVAQAKGEAIAPGLLLDVDGQVTVDPDAFNHGGALLPFGGHKGYGLSVMIEILGGVLSGMAPSALEEYRGGNGTLVLAIAVDAFVPLATLYDQVQRLCELLVTTPPADGVAEVLLPGEVERRARAERTAHGIPVPETTWAELIQLAETLGVAL